MNLPIKRGTARRLGIRQPIDPALYDVESRLKLLAWQMDVIAAMYGQPPWRLRAAAIDPGLVFRGRGS